MEKETFSNYDITKAMTLLNLSHPLKWDIPLNSVSPSDFLTVGLREAERQVIIGSNKSALRRTFLTTEDTKGAHKGHKA